MSNGVESIKSSLLPSSHTGDIVSLDVAPGKGQMVSASIDNKICFWAAYTCTEMKNKMIKVPVSDSETDAGFGNYIQAVRYADKDSSEFVIIVMNTGQVYVFETQTSTFQSKGGNSG